MKAVEARRRRSFRLTRFFSLASSFGILVVTLCLFWAYREFTLGHLIDHESRANADLARVFANAVWDKYRPLVAGSRGRSRESLLADPLQSELRAEVLGRMRGLKVAKVKIYNTDGLTVFSTDTKQVGEDKSGNAGFRRALAGRIASDITYRDKFDAFEGVLSQRNLIFSYIPVGAGPGGGPDGVFEIYSDVTELMARQTRAQWQVAGIVLAALGTLYLFLSFIVGKADRFIARQEAERAEQEALIRHQAYHDALTGLPNRTYFTERLTEALAHAVRHGQAGAVMFIDLDRFKIVNDSLGHEAGDRLLKAAGERIRGCLRKNDLLFRMGGDEFMAILPEIAEPGDAVQVARRINAAVDTPVSIHEHEVSVGATIGIAVFPDDGDTADAIVKNADAAMYSAKQSKRGTYAFYRRAMNERAMLRLGLETALQKAFRAGEFVLHYQPRLDAATRRVVAVEALLRWQCPKRGLVLPGEFIGVLEDMGMMPIVGEWVLRTACQQLRRWQEQGLGPLRMSVNVSARQFQSPSFVALVERVLGDVGVRANLVELELTESLLITNPDQARAAIAGLKQLGVRIALDDFGTGYSSLSYLRLLAVDCLKIDRSFVTEIATSPRDQAVAAAIADLAIVLGMTMVAEGVETEAQANFFAGIRCRELQGFLFSKPVAADALTQYLAASRDAGAVARPDERATLPAVAAMTPLAAGAG